MGNVLSSLLKFKRIPHPLRRYAVPDLPIGWEGLKSRGSLVKVYNIFDTVISLSYICCHYAL